MSENNLPDRASDFDDDIPTYAPLTDKPAAADKQATRGQDSATANFYSKAGRVAPQAITPDAAKTSSKADGEKTEIIGERDANSSATTVFERPNVSSSGAGNRAGAGYSNDHNARLASDAPTSNYDDDDFAPRGKAASSSEPTTVFAAEAPASEPTLLPPSEPTQVLSTATPAAAYDSDPYATAPAAAPIADPAAQVSTEGVAQVVQAKRGTMDFGLFILRLAVSAYLLLDSLRVFFNMGANGGLNQLESQFSDYAAPTMLAIGVPALELAAGVFLLFGLLTPVAAAVGTVATTFLFGHFIYTTDSLAVFDLPDKVWLGLMLVVATLTLQFTGPGWISFDVSRSWAKRPLYSSWIFAVISVAGAVALWWFGAGLNPLG